MGWGNTLKRVGLGVATGGMSETANMLSGGDLFDKQNPSGGYNSTMDKARQDLIAQYNKARTGFQSATRGLPGRVSQGFTEARGKVAGGMSTARGTMEAGYNKGEEALKAGYNEAKGQYETEPGMVATRQELYNRVLGKGGMSPEALAATKANTVDQYGTALREASRAQQFIGGSQAGGLAGENVARAITEAGGERARALRDIDIQNEMMKREEMTGALGMTADIAAKRAGLSTQEGSAIADLATRAGEGLGSLDANEAQMLATLARDEGTTLADLQTKLASGDVELMTKLADAVATMQGTQAASNVQIDAARHSGGLLGGGGFLGTGIGA